jgi:FkbM family methyltransferase
MKLKHYGYLIENEMFWGGIENGWDKVSMNLWLNLAKDANTIMDIGSNTGVYSMVANAVSPSAKIMAFEPVERIAKKFKRNVALNKAENAINLYPLALSNENGTAIIYDSMHEHVYSVTVGQDHSAENVQTKEVEISIERLDTFIERNQISKIDLMKIDVETHEPEVLEGMGKYLQSFQPDILIEVITDEIGQQVEKFIDGLGYLIYYIDEINTPKLVSKIKKDEGMNYLICKPSSAEKLGLNTK